MKQFVISVFFLLTAALSSAQYVDQGQDAPFLKWYVIKTTHFKVIFPEGFEKQAQRCAALLEESAELVTQSMNKKPVKVSVVLHTQSAYSNAMVVWAPKRMQFYTYPPQNNYAQDWMAQLALHEYRHVLQVNLLNRGVTQLLSFVFGQQATAVVLGVFIPLWLLEGDAIATETAFSHAGRGRVPSFTCEMDALLLDEEVPGYVAASLGSYRRYIPSHYHLGYLMVSQVRQTYREDVFTKAINSAGNFPFMISAFNLSLWESTGKRIRRLYNESMQNYADSLKKEKKSIKPSRAQWAGLQKQNPYSHFLQPVVINNRLIVLRRNMEHIPVFTELRQGKRDKKLLTPGILNSDAFSSNDEWLVWSEFIPGVRFQNRSYTRIKAKNLVTGETRVRGKKMRLLSPAISPDSKRLALIENNEDYSQHIVIMDFDTDEVLQRFPVPEKQKLLSPSWAPDGDSLVAVLLDERGKAVVSIYPVSGQINILTPFSHAEINEPIVYGNLLMFSASFTGRDEIYIFSPATSDLRRVTTARYSHRSPFPDLRNHRLYFNSYTSKGNTAVYLSMDSLENHPAEFIAKTPSALAETLSEQEGNKVINEFPDATFPVKRYNRLLNSVNIHSWGTISNTMLEERPGLIMSQNLLSTAFFKVGYDQDNQAKNGMWFTELTYKRFFPVFSFSYDVGDKIKKMPKGIIPYDRRDFPYRDRILKAAVSFPMNFSRAAFQTGVTPQIAYMMRTETYDAIPRPYFEDTQEDFGFGSLSVYHVKRMSIKDLQPSFGIWGRSWVSFHNDIGFDKSIYAAEAYGFLPGIMQHHGIMLYAGMQNRVMSSGQGIGNIRIPRGNINSSFRGAVSYSIDYVLPIAYLEADLGIFYLNRARARVFYDIMTSYTIYTRVTHRTDVGRGLEFTGDFYFFRFPFPLEIGVLYGSNSMSKFQGLIVRSNLFNF